MFAQKIESIQTQIQQLQQQQAKYQDLHTETQNALSLLTKIRSQALELGEADTVAIAFLEALQIQPNLEVPTTIDIESHTEIEEDLPEEDYEDNEWVEETALDEKYSRPSELAAALEAEDPETVLMEIANVLDSAPATEIQGRVWYFVRNLPVELGDRIISYLPKSIVPEWRKQMDVLAKEAKASIFPQAEQPTTTYEPAIDDMVECLSNGMVGRITYICDAPEGKKATVLVPGGASNFHVSNLKYIGKFEGEKPEDAPNSNHAVNETSTNDEMDQLARQCLGLRSWSQMRIFADSNPAVITRMQEIASTKAELRVINNLPSLVIGYIQRANDRTDLEWLPDPVLSEVEALLAQPQEQSIA